MKNKILTEDEIDWGNIKEGDYLVLNAFPHDLQETGYFMMPITDWRKPMHFRLTPNKDAWYCMGAEN